MFQPLMLFDDSVFGATNNVINQMMNTMNHIFPEEFRRGPGGMHVPQSMSLMPFGGPPGNSLMQMMGPRMSNHGFPNNMGSCFSSSTVMTFSNGPNGQPQVYQESSSTIAGPGGVRETKKSVQDSRTGKKKMSIGHYIGDRGHIKEREQNIYSGDQEENEEFVNLEEDEAESFNQEFEQKANRFKSRSAGYGGAGSGGNMYRIANVPHYQQPSIQYPGHQQHSPPSPQTSAEDLGYRYSKKKSHNSKPYMKKKKSPK